MSDESTEPRSFTGRDRRRTTSWGIRAADWIAQSVITVGGIGTIASVLLVCLFLLWVVLPLFGSASLGESATTSLPWSPGAAVRFRVDEHGVIGWAIELDGSLAVFHLETGESIDRQPAFETTAKATAHTVAPFVRSERDLRDNTIADERALAVGFDDGTVGYGVIAIKTDILESTDVPEEIAAMPRDETRVLEHDGRRGVVEWTPEGQLRLQSVLWKPEAPFEAAAGPVERLDVVVKPLTGPTFGVWSTEGGDPKLAVVTARIKGAFRKTLQMENSYDVPLPNVGTDTPTNVLFNGLGTKLFVGWESGRLLRFDLRRVSQPVLAEEIDLTPDDETRVTALEMLLGRETLVVGDSAGGLSGWFTVRPVEGAEPAGTPDGQQLVRAHTLPTGTAGVRSIGLSSRTRSFVAGFDDGRLGVYLMTTESRFHETAEPFEAPIGLVAIAPKDDALFVTTGETMWRAEFHRSHPEITFGSLFTPIWYEGYPEPRHEWQSGGGSQELEPKFGLVPLIFGSLKATFYSMLFGAPLALLAAIYSSEFLHPATKHKVKPTIEIMASLPSVVLGFLAALVFAPVVERFVPALLASFVTVPFCYVLVAKGQQLLPERTALAVARWRFPLAFLVLPVGVWIAWSLGPFVETLLFDGDVMLWLNDTKRGNGIGAWLILLLPLSVFVVAILSGRLVRPWLLGLDRDRGEFARIEFVRFLAEAALVAVIALGLAVVFQFGFDWDPRGSYVDTYVQRNALVVGFVMGFAIIPIVYTIADDALSSVPDNLRAASLGAGATPWQTTVRIVVPTATSGLFSALMIGLGRAVGETMIVLMAAGNTPVMDYNVFNGFRTLSANIAVELPEASKDGTHYRALFLTALVLFLMTFVLNTIAELVRLRFRKKVVQL